MATAQVLYAMIGCIEDVAQAYVRQKRVRASVANPWLDEGFASACAGIEEAERERLLAPVTPEGLRAVAAARQYLVEHGLVQWVAHQSVTKGIAPTAAVAAQELVTPSAPLGLVTPSAPRAWKTAKHERQWVRRWSRRFNLQRGCFKVGPRLPLAASRLKAATARNSNT